MDGKKVGLLLVGVLGLSCAGVVAGAGSGWFAWQDHLKQEETEAYCLVVRQEARERWMATIGVFEEQQAHQHVLLAEHASARERATLLRDLEGIDRYDGHISAAENQITSLSLAIAAAEEMQTALATQPADAIVQKALLLGEISRDDRIREVLSGPMTATLALQDRCVL
ncbi:MAG: hypothetical protein ACI8RZ_002093 [Myxococcota bacterium]|jgi:hypothetical protein